VARFRRQQPITPRSDSDSFETKTLHRAQSDDRVDMTNDNKFIHIPLRQTQSQENLMSSSPDEIKPPIIMNKQRERIEVNQSMSSGGFPLLLQQQQQTEMPTTPDKKVVNEN
jgi:hypothetical protein